MKISTAHMDDKKVAIIGGGPAGLAAARAILAESADYKVYIFEARVQFGGLWNYSPAYGPMYRTMDANVPRWLINFSDAPFQPGKDVYPSRQEVLEYVQNYSRKIARDPRVTVYFNTKVTKITKKWGSWLIESKSNSKTTDNSLLEADFVVAASGHYEFPYLPAIPGLREHPGVIHSVDYDAPEEFANKRTLLVGNARSGTDLAIQILGYTAPVTISRRKVGPTDQIFDPAAESEPHVVWKPEVERIDGTKVTFKDGTSDHYDRIVSCTGYLYEFPYLQFESTLPYHHKTRTRLCNFYKHTFFIGDSSLVTLGMNKGMVPFPTFEAQGAVIARVWSGRLTLPPTEVQLGEEKEIREAQGDEDKFHQLSTDGDVGFMRFWWDWADQAPGGFHAERWIDSKTNMRANILDGKVVQYKEKILLAKAQREARSDTSTILA